MFITRVVLYLPSKLGIVTYKYRREGFIQLDLKHEV